MGKHTTTCTRCGSTFTTEHNWKNVDTEDRVGSCHDCRRTAKEVFDDLKTFFRIMLAKGED